jgi:hypothetical protein
MCSKPNWAPRRWFNISLILGGVAVVADASYVLTRSFGACPVTTAEDLDRYEKIIAAFDDLVSFATTVSVAMVAFSAALLAGLNVNVTLDKGAAFFVPIALICFAWSTFLGVWWRLGVADAWYSNCLALIEKPILAAPYSHQLYFFIAGIGVSAIVVFSLARTRASPT